MLFRSNANGDVIADMNTTPLIDVLLVLLVLLIVTLPLQSHRVAMDMPHGVPITGAKPPVIDVAVDFDGTIFWNGAPLPDRATLDHSLAIEAQKPFSEQAEIHVRPDRLAKYGAVALVLADAQRLGVQKVGFAGNEQYME